MNRLRLRDGPKIDSDQRGDEYPNGGFGRDPRGGVARFKRV